MWTLLEGYTLAVSVLTICAVAPLVDPFWNLGSAMPAAATGANLGNLRLLLDRAIVEGVKRALEVAIRHASLQHLIRGTDFPATLVSLTSLTLVPSLWDPSISILVHGGTISGITDEVIARE
jgi:hypothetical protein